MAHSVVRIERKTASTSKDAERLRLALVAADRPDVTPADAAALSGLPIAHCEDALWHLASELAPRIRVSEAGALRFTFSTLERPRPGLGAWLRRHAMGLKLLGLLVVMPGYFLTVAAHAGALATAPVGFGVLGLALKAIGAIAFVPMVLLGIGSFFQFLLMPVGGLALLYVSLGMLLPTWLKNQDDTFTTIFMVVSLFMGVCWCLGAYLFYRHWVFGRRNLFGMKLWRAVVGTLFGGDLALDDSLSDEKRLTALVARRRGVITTADLVALFGWTPEEADGQIARILCDYGGDVVVTEEGAIAYRFASLAETDAPAHIDTRPIYEREADYPAFFQAPAGFVRGFAAMTAIGLTGLLLRPNPSFWPNWAGEGSLSDQVMGQALGGVPYALIASILVVRFVVWRQGRAAFEETASYRRLVKLAVEHPEGRFVKRVPTKLLAKLGGTIDVDRTRADGAVWVHFPAFAAGDRAAEALRQETGASAGSEVAFDTAT